MSVCVNLCIVTTAAIIGCARWSHLPTCDLLPPCKAVINNPGLTPTWQPVQRKVEHKTDEVVEKLVYAAERLPMFKQAGLDNEMRESLVIMCEDSTYIV